ncbi:zinc finger protein 652-B-like [Contarinia nasturtii]|uniref:zinc finger protein 652-B-like n=1 Tax=Contarinia nasturtii TaxID=265458 RepID=UPI0012D4103E|nr:zinc finger protein 652-B-like [Contarinia nasturtii]
MEVTEETERCRLCFSQVTKFIDIFGESALTQNIIEPLNQYFYDEVTKTDTLPKIICCTCWEKVKAFRNFAEEAIALRQEYLKQNNTTNHENAENNDLDDSETANVEAQVHEETVYVEPVPTPSIDGGDNKLTAGKSNYETSCDDSSDKWFNAKGPSKSEIDDVDLPDCADKSCDLCQKTVFKTYNAMIRHYREDHNITSGYVKCCQQKFYDIGFYKEHTAWQHINPDVFRPILEWHHEEHKIGSFLCEICAEEFKSKPELDNHVELHLNGIIDHRPRLKFQCNQCNKISPNGNALQTHIRQVHCESKYKCHLCSKSFKMEDSLKDHVSMHLKSKKYKCSYCRQEFVWRSNMYKHQKQLHRNEWLSEKMRWNTAPNGSWNVSQ